jgi:hypothetical protein
MPNAVETKPGYGKRRRRARSARDVVRARLAKRSPFVHAQTLRSNGTDSRLFEMSSEVRNDETPSRFDLSSVLSPRTRTCRVDGDSRTPRRSPRKAAICLGLGGTGSLSGARAQPAGGMKRPRPSRRAARSRARVVALSPANRSRRCKPHREAQLFRY